MAGRRRAQARSTILSDSLASFAAPPGTSGRTPAAQAPKPADMPLLFRDAIINPDPRAKSTWAPTNLNVDPSRDTAATFSQEGLGWLDQLFRTYDPRRRIVAPTRPFGLEEY
jgi:hypothetical protein